MNRHDLQNLAEAYTAVHEKKDSSYLETDMKKRQENNEKARKDMEKVKGQKNPHFEEKQQGMQEGKADAGKSADDKATARNDRNNPVKGDPGFGKFARATFDRLKDGQSLATGKDSASSEMRRKAHAQKRGVKKEEVSSLAAAYQAVYENRRAAGAAGGYKDDSKKQTDPSKDGFTGISGSIKDIMKQNKEIEAKNKKMKKEEVEQYVDFLIDEGYDCSELTWDEISEEYDSLDEGLRSAVKKLFGKKDAPAANKPESRGDQLRKKYNVGPEKSDTSAKMKILQKTRAKKERDQKEFGGSRYSKSVAKKSADAHDRYLKGGYSKYGADDARGKGNKAAKRAAALRKEEIDEAMVQVKGKKKGNVIINPEVKKVNEDADVAKKQQVQRKQLMLNKQKLALQQKATTKKKPTDMHMEETEDIQEVDTTTRSVDYGQEIENTALKRKKEKKSLTDFKKLSKPKES